MAVFDGAEARLPTGGATAGWWVCCLHFFRFSAAYWGGDLDTARSEARQALESARPLGSPSMLATALLYHALAPSEHDPEATLAAVEEGIRLVQAGAANSVYSTMLLTAASLRSASGDTVGAARHLRVGVEHEGRVGASRPMVAALVALGAVVLAGRPDGLDSAATLSGAVSGPVFGPIGLFTLGAQQSLYDACVDEVARTLGPSAYASAHERGAAMTYDEIVAYTLDQLDCLIDL